ncbi:MAG: polysaccharide deacetylase family protein [Pseudomonadota bacterium]
MPLDPSYLEFPKRREGMDHDLYPARNLFKDSPVTWPDGKKVALWITVAVEYFPLTPNDGPFRAAGHMVTPFPDYRTYTTRDYGNRIGIYRVMDALDQAGFPATAFISSALFKRTPKLIKDIKAAGWELAAHGVDMNQLHYGGMESAEEHAQIERCKADWAAAGLTPHGWMSPGRSQSDHTLDFLKDAGFTWTADWGNDDMPFAMNNGLAALPFTDELEDRKSMVTLGHNEEMWSNQITDAANWLSNEAERYGGRILHIALTPYVIGQPFRIQILKDLLASLAARDDIWAATGSDIYAACCASTKR